MGLFYLSIGVVLVLAHVDSFDTSVGYLICSSVDFALGALIGKVMGFLLVTCLVRSLGGLYDFLCTFIRFISSSLVCL